MHKKHELILKYRSDVENGKKITKSMATELFNISNEFLLNLSDAANYITRHFHGSRVDIEELANIKKIFVVKTVHFVRNQHFSIQKLLAISFHHLKK